MKQPNDVAFSYGRRRSELRPHEQLLAENPGSAALREEHERLRGQVLGEEVDHLYEVVGSLPPSPG